MFEFEMMEAVPFEEQYKQMREKYQQGMISRAEFVNYCGLVLEWMMTKNQEVLDRLKNV